MVNKKRVSSILILALLITSLFSGFAFAADNDDWVVAKEIDIKADAHIQKDADKSFAGKGEIEFGTTGDSKRLEKIAVKLEGDVPEDMAIEYMAHVQKDDDTPWTKGPNPVGTDGQSKRLEGVAFKLVDKDGKLYPGYTVEYQVHMETYGWGISADENDRNNDGKINDNFTKWAADGEYAGTRQKSKRIEAVRLRIRREDELKVTSVNAINSKTIKVKFNKKLSNVLASNFTVSKKNDPYALKVIDKVETDGNVVTITLIEKLDANKEYVLKAKNVKAIDGTVLEEESINEFLYKEVEAASISFVKTTVAIGDTIKVVIKDAEGNDITANYSKEDLDVQSSNSTIVDQDLKALTKGAVIVNVKIKDTEIETGNTIIDVKESLAVLTSIGKWTLSGGSYENPVTSLFEKESKSILAEALDQNGKRLNTVTFSYRSLTPTVAVVDSTTGVITPVSSGVATILITGTDGSKTVNKTIQVVVKPNAKASTLQLNTNAIKLVKGSAVAQELKIEVLDQYGDVMEVNDTLKYKINKDNIVNGLVANQEQELNFTDGKASLALHAGTTVGTATMTITYGNLTKTIPVSLVEQASFAGYLYEVDATKLDLIAKDDPEYKDLKQGEDSATIRVYTKDANGNKISELSYNDFELVEANDKADSAVKVEGATVVAQNTGDEVVTIKVGDVVIGRVNFKVVDSTRKLKNVLQLRNAITVSKDTSILDSELFGTDKDGNAFVGYDQYGDKIKINANSDVQVFTSNSSIIDTNLTFRGSTGTVDLTLKIGDQIFSITVKVN